MTENASKECYDLIGSHVARLEAFMTHASRKAATRNEDTVETSTIQMAFGRIHKYLAARKAGDSDLIEMRNKAMWDYAEQLPLGLQGAYAKAAAVAEANSDEEVWQAVGADTTQKHLDLTQRLRDQAIELLSKKEKSEHFQLVARAFDTVFDFIRGSGEHAALEGITRQENGLKKTKGLPKDVLRCFQTAACIAKSQKFTDIETAHKTLESAHGAKR